MNKSGICIKWIQDKRNFTNYFLVNWFAVIFPRLIWILLFPAFAWFLKFHFDGALSDYTIFWHCRRDFGDVFAIIRLGLTELFFFSFLSLDKKKQRKINEFLSAIKKKKKKRFWWHGSTYVVCCPDNRKFSLAIIIIHFLYLFIKLDWFLCFQTVFNSYVFPLIHYSLPFSSYFLNFILCFFSYLISIF